MSQYNLIPENYRVKEVILNELSIEKYYNTEYISIQTKDGASEQYYPACKIQDLNAGIEYLLDCFDGESLQDIKGKKAWSVCTGANVFCLINPENNKMFSLGAKFFPESYSNVLDQIKSQPGNEFLDKLDNHDALLVGVLKSIPVKGPLEERVVNLVNSYSRYTILNQELPPSGGIAPKKKKI